MPQKKNPDAAELVRGKTGRVVGDLVSLLVTLKGLPLSYNRDMQEDKAPVLDAVETARDCLLVLAGAIASLRVNAAAMARAAADPMLLATDLADHLVLRGVPFREAHGIVGRVVAHALAQKTLARRALARDAALVPPRARPRARGVLLGRALARGAPRDRRAVARAGAKPRSPRRAPSSRARATRWRGRRPDARARSSCWSRRSPSAACGKYGPPVRTTEPTPKPAPRRRPRRHRAVSGPQRACAAPRSDAVSRIRFAKMHGAGNDLVVDRLPRRRSRSRTGRRFARFALDRRLGIGGDQLLLVQPSRDADFTMAIRNADGSPAPRCARTGSAPSPSTCATAGLTAKERDPRRDAGRASSRRAGSATTRSRSR